MKEVCSHLGVFENKEHDGHVHILLKGEHLLSLNKNLRSPPTPVLLIKTLLADTESASKNPSSALGTALDIFALLVRQRARIFPQ